MSSMDGKRKIIPLIACFMSFMTAIACAFVFWGHRSGPSKSAAREGRQGVESSKSTTSGASRSKSASAATMSSPTTLVATRPNEKKGGAMANSSPDLPKPLRGITLDSIENLNQSLNLIKSSSQKLTVRVVMDSDESLDNYGKAVEALHPHAYVMVQVVDSQEMAQKSVADVRSRAAQAMAKFGDKVDLWEVGNELNGDWAGSSPGEINAKVAAAHDVVAQAGRPTALTLNYWSSPDCYEHAWEDTMRFAHTVSRQPDYVFLSIYETACDPPQHPTAADIAHTLTALGTVFPHARLGIGEVGAQNRSDGRSQDPGLAEKQQIAQCYYGMHNELRAQVGPRFVGGYFWWYFHADAVRGGLWPTLRQLISGLGDDDASESCAGSACGAAPAPPPTHG